MLMSCPLCKEELNIGFVGGFELLPQEPVISKK